MEIYHRISFNNLSDQNLLGILQSRSIECIITPSLRRKENFLVTFEIQESDPAWDTIKEHVHDDFLDLIYTIFSEEEILKSEWSRLTIGYENGYPEPKNSWGIENNYDVLCDHCGLVRQNALFRIKKEPEFRGNGFLSIYKLVELFCTTQVAEVLLQNEIKGFKIQDVLLHKLDQPAETIKQLVIPVQAKPGLVDKEALEPTLCQKCNTPKYRNHRRGYWKFRKSAFEGIDEDFVFSNEWFGSGYMAYREFFVTRKVAKIVIDQGWEGVFLQPLLLV
jgi:hypothetical protein